MRVLLLALAVLPASHTKAQGLTETIMRRPPLKVPAYTFPMAGSRHTLLTMKFASNQWLDTSGFALLQNAQILAVDLVFTDYPARLDLVPLNTSRFKALFARLPQLAQDSNITFAVVRQMDGRTKALAAGMVHGFVVHYRPAPQPTDVEDERYLIKTAIPPPPAIPAAPTGPQPKLRHWDYKYRSATPTPESSPDAPLPTHHPCCATRFFTTPPNGKAGNKWWWWPT